MQRYAAAPRWWADSSPLEQPTLKRASRAWSLCTPQTQDSQTIVETRAFALDEQDRRLMYPAFVDGGVVLEGLETGPLLGSGRLLDLLVGEQMPRIC